MTCVDDLWRIVNVLHGDPVGSATIEDIEQFEEALRALVGVAAAHRRHLKIRSRISGPPPVRTPSIAASVDLGLERDNCRPLQAPFSTDPVDWARAFVSSGDWQDEVRTYIWFRNAMRAANPDAVEPEDRYRDDVPSHPHGRPPRG